MAKPAKHNNPHIVSVVGGSGYGKSTWLYQQIKSSPRVLVWDPKNEYARRDKSFKVVGRCSDLRAALIASPDRVPARIAFVPYSMDWFNFWCVCAHDWGHADIVAEETSDVTHGGKAPKGWGVVLRRGGDVGLRVYGTTQRPAESDKTILGNRTLVHCHGLPRPDDRKYMAREMGIDQRVLDELKEYEWIEVDRKGTIKRGKTTKPQR